VISLGSLSSLLGSVGEGSEGVVMSVAIVKNVVSRSNRVSRVKETKVMEHKMLISAAGRKDYYFRFSAVKDSSASLVFTSFT
jgi:hypothetical protein